MFGVPKFLTSEEQNVYSHDIQIALIEVTTATGRHQSWVTEETMDD